MQSQNPFDESVFATYDRHGKDDAVKRLMNGQPDRDGEFAYDCGSMDIRRQRLLQTAALLRERQIELSKLMTREMGKPIVQSEAEVEKSAACCDYFAQHAEQMLQPQVIETEASYSEVRYEPLGTILAIMPWNFPVWQVIRFAAPTLMAGNRILLKHAPNVCGCAEMLESIFDDSFGQDAVCNLRLSNEDTAWLIRSGRVAGVTLTGSEQAGREVGKVAGEAIRKCVMELGGVDPFIVLEDADLDLAAQAAVLARTLNNGQSCIAAKRLIVMKSIAAEFTERFVDAMSRLKVGDPMDRSIEIGPLARQDLRDKLHDQVRFEVEERSARLLLGGTVPDRPGWFYPPTVIVRDSVDRENHISETFGPVATIEVAAPDDDWLEALNRSNYGLGASLWTQDIDRAKQLIPKLRCGSVFINQITKSDPRLPFGGIGDSGYGRELSREGLLEFTNVKTVWIE